VHKSAGGLTVPPNLILIHCIVHEDHVDVCTVSLGDVEEEQWRLLVKSIVCG